MRKKKLYSRVITLSNFCERYLGIVCNSDDEMIRVFVEYNSRKRKIEKGIKIEGRAKGKGSFATTRAEFERINKKLLDPEWIKGNIPVLKWSRASVTAAILGFQRLQCNRLLVLHFWAFDDEVKKPTIEDAPHDKNFIPGGRTKNLITESTDDGVVEVVIKPILATRIKKVDYIGHINYNL
jgi:hypothetical protein